MKEGVKDFVHLHLHTQFSLLDGAIKIGDLVRKAKEFGYKAVGVSDHGNLFGSYQFYKALKSEGIKPIIGMEAYFTTGSRFDRKSKGSEDNITDKYNHHLILIAKNDTGLKNLFKLSTLAYKEGFYYKPRIDYELLEKYGEGLIALTACLKGVPTYYASINETEKAREWVRKFKDIFGEDLYLELQSNDLDEQAVANRNLIDIAKKYGVKLIATNDSHYLNPEDKEAHTVLMAIQMKRTIHDITRGGFRCANDGLHFASPEEVWRKFEGKFDGWEKALLNTLEVMEKTSDSFEFFENNSYLLPEYSVPKDTTLEEHLKELAVKGLKQRIARGQAKNSKEYWERLEYELDVINRIGFAGYFLIVQDFINWAKTNGIPVGPGRGSAAGSLVAYAVGITDVDPIKHGLLFERFLNPERVSMPDIDVDFCQDNRDRVIEYVKEKYGRENVAQIITYNVMKAKQTLRDVARALGLPYSTADQLAKLIPQGDVQGTWLSLEEMYQTPIEVLKERYGVHRGDIEDNANKFRKLCKENPEIEKLVQIALRLEGLTRHTSLHAAGVVIAPKPLDELVPLFYDRDGAVATQYDMTKLEDMGLLKMDFLGLKTLTELKGMRDLVEARKGVRVDFLTLPMDDPKVFELLQEGNTTGVFQLESRGMKELLKRLKPDSFEDIVAVLALYRPGPLKSGLVDRYINRKHGKEAVEYIFPELEEVLRETYGVIVYQEQVMKMSQILAGFTPGEADTLRKAIGKKKKDLMEQMREKFIKGAVDRGFPENKITKLWEDIEKFASYSFNKSHSVAYGYISYWTAYMKAHHPAEFFAVKLTTEKNDNKFINLIKDAKLMGFEILPPDVNRSDVGFKIEGDKKIRFGIGRVKGVGEEAARSIVDARDRGEFRGIQDFVRRVDGRKVNKKVLECLVKAGAFDFTGSRREELLERLSSGKSTANLAQNALFGGAQKRKKTDINDILRMEKEVIGFYISGHPLDKYDSLLATKYTPIEEIETAGKGSTLTIAGVISNLQVKKTKNGNYMAIFNLIDRSGVCEVIVFPDAYEEFKERIKEDKVVIIKGYSDEDEETESLKFIAQEVLLPEELTRNGNGYITLILRREDALNGKMEKLKELLERFSNPEGLQVVFEIKGKDFHAVLHLPPDYRINPSPEFINFLTKKLKIKVVV
ncbi:DNA polymerase III subunit alpha [Hydrogenivirga caldilitoris]|nr:DNA polymerase III subunit alpha [Hydrogenivirga caldilitoris]